MKLTKLLITSLAFVTIGSTSLFAMAASTAGTDTSTDTTGTSSDAKVSTTGTSSDAKVSTTTALDSKPTGNSGDNVKIIGSVAANPLVTSLYYNSTNITKDSTTEPTYIYDAAWDVQTGFTTDTFSVALEGSTGDNTKSQLEVAIKASPFYLSTSNDKVYAGNVTITKKLGASTETKGSSLAPGKTASLTIDSEFLAANTYYNGLYSSKPGVGQENGLVAGFTITAEPTTRVLPSGRYVSTVTLAYSMK